MTPEAEEMLLYESVDAPETPEVESGRFDDIGVFDSDLEWRTPEEKKDFAKEAAVALVERYVAEKKLPEPLRVWLLIHPSDTGEEILTLVQKAKKYADSGKPETFVSTLEQGTWNTKADVVSGLMEQLNAKDSTQVKERVTEIMFTNEEYSKVTWYRQAFKMIRINKMMKNLSDRLKRSPTEAMQYMVWLSTNVFNRRLRKFTFGRADKMMFGWTGKRINARVDSVQEAVDDMKKIFEPFKSQFPLFTKIWNLYLKEVKIAAEIK